MKLIIIILFLFPAFAKAQKDTIGKTIQDNHVGVFYMDTIKVPNNKTGVYLLSLIGGAARAIKLVTVSNTNGVYKIVSNTNPVAFNGFTGGKFEVVLLNKLVQVKVTGTKNIIQWQLTNLNLEYR